MVHVIQNKTDLDERLAVAGDKLFVIDFFANWCGPCKIISPKLEELAEKYKDIAFVVKVDVDDNEEIALEYNVTSMPTFVFIKNSKIIDISVGGNSEKLMRNMEKYIFNEITPPPIKEVPTPEIENEAQIEIEGAQSMIEEKK